MKLTGAAARRFVDKPDAQMRAALFYGPNRAMVADASAALAKFALAGSDDPFATTKLSEDEIKKDKARLLDALSAQSLLGGPTLVWARVDGEGANDSILFALAQIEKGAPGGFLVIEGGELSGTGKLVKAFESAKSAVAAAFYEESPAERAAFARELLAERVENGIVRAFAIDARPHQRRPAEQRLSRKRVRQARFVFLDVVFRELGRAERIVAAGQRERRERRGRIRHHCAVRAIEEGGAHLRVRLIDEAPGGCAR